MTDDLVVELTAKTIEVVKAPHETVMSLDILASFDPDLLYVSGDEVAILSKPAVVYRVTGWDPEAKVLKLARQE